jgi:hypothetical protein
MYTEGHADVTQNCFLFMKFLDTENGIAILQFYQYFSPMYMGFALCGGSVSLCYQIYANWHTTRKSKRLFLVQTFVSFIMLTMRVLLSTFLQIILF